MFWPERSVQYHKRQTDCAIRHAYARLATNTPAVAKFDELLYYVRDRGAHLLKAPVLNGNHPGVEALVNLSRFVCAHIRPAAAWSGTTSSWRPAVSSLAHHLVCKYDVPLFLTSSWHSKDDSASDDRRRWFVAHAGGASFRSLSLPIAMTRRMERIFLASADHLTMDRAMRRAELLALGAPAEIVQAVLATRLATDLRNGEFWRTVWIFLVANASIMDPAQIGPMIDYIQGIRHDRIALQTHDGPAELDPPQPTFSMKGRTVQSMLRLMSDWHRSLGLASSGLAWSPSALQPMFFEEPSQDPSDLPRRWQLLELTNSAQLRIEGAALHHCVASYAHHCHRGESRIWSLRFWRGEKVHHVLTIEVDPRKRAVVQARGRANRLASGRPLQLLREWAHRERVRLAI